MNSRLRILLRARGASAFLNPSVSLTHTQVTTLRQAIIRLGREVCHESLNAAPEVCGKCSSRLEKPGCREGALSLRPRGTRCRDRWETAPSNTQAQTTGQWPKVRLLGAPGAKWAGDDGDRLAGGEGRWEFGVGKGRRERGPGPRRPGRKARVQAPEKTGGEPVARGWCEPCRISVCFFFFF